MGLLDTVRSTALRGKVSAEIVVLETKAGRQPLSLGVALFDALQASKSPPKQLLAVIQDDYQAAVRAVREKKDSMDAKALEYERVTVHKERTTALQDSASQKTKTWLSDTASQAQLQTSIQLLDRDMLLLKQEFGKSVFDRALEFYEQHAQSKTTQLKGKFAQAAANTFGTQNKTDAVTAVLESAFKERASTQNRIEAKKRELTAIAQGVR